MRKKVMKLVVTFHTTSDAMAMEKVCKERNVPGRLIPVPRAISAGCGLSWCADLTDREQILDVMKEVGIEQEDVCGQRLLIFLYKGNWQLLSNTWRLKSIHKCL